MKGKGSRIELDPDEVRRGLGKLVLTVIELLRDVMERQALRRVQAGSLSRTKVDQLGRTFLRLREEMETLKKHFGVEDEDLTIRLPPLERLP